MIDYNQLDMEYKRGLLVNFQVCNACLRASIWRSAKEDWLKQLVADSNDVVDELTNQEVEKLVQGIQD